MTARRMVKQCTSCGDHKERAEFPAARSMKCSACHVSRVCIRCGERKPVEHFPLATGSKNTGTQNRMRRCHPCYTSDRRKSYAQGGRDQRLAWQYGISATERDLLFESQDSACAICRSSEPGGHGWCIDHDHACCPAKSRSCGKCVRGILCFSCNVALGCVKDDVDRLKAAIDYLQANVSRMRPVA